MVEKLNSQRLAWPADWTQLFGRERPLILEIGFGYGAFLLHLARNNPEANVIGLEIASKCLRAAEEAIDKHRLTNVRVIHSTAETGLHHLFQPGSLQQIHINFPDPWFKKRHGHRRLMQRDTLDAMVNRLEVSGMLCLATDIIEYAEMSAELLAQTPGLDNTLGAAWVTEMPGRTVTKYEGKARREGRNCYYFAYRRNSLPPPDIRQVEELEMPHIVLSTPLTLDEMLEPFQTSEHKAGSTHITLLYGYRGKNSLLFEAYVKEPTIDQRVAIVLTPRETPNEYTLKLGVIGHPRSTPGIHMAAGILGDWLASLHPDARILQRKLKED